MERLGLGLTFDQFGPKNMRSLIADYRQTELTEEGDPEGLAFSTKDNARCYLRKWIEPHWAEYSLADVKAVDVEAWLKKVKRTVFVKNNPVGGKSLAPGTKKKIKDLMDVLFNTPNDTNGQIATLSLRYGKGGSAKTYRHWLTLMWT